jgi:hypothetical protein
MHAAGQQLGPPGVSTKSVEKGMRDIRGGVEQGARMFERGTEQCAGPIQYPRSLLASFRGKCSPMICHRHFLLHASKGGLSSAM